MKRQTTVHKICVNSTIQSKLKMREEKQELAGCLCWEDKKEGLESNSFVLILDLMEGEKPKSL